MALSILCMENGLTVKFLTRRDRSYPISNCMIISTHDKTALNVVARDIHSDEEIRFALIPDSLAHHQAVNHYIHDCILEYPSALLKFTSPPKKIRNAGYTIEVSERIPPELVLRANFSVWCDVLVDSKGSFDLFFTCAPLF